MKILKYYFVRYLELCIAYLKSLSILVSKGLIEYFLLYSKEKSSIDRTVIHNCMSIQLSLTHCFPIIHFIDTILTTIHCSQALMKLDTTQKVTTRSGIEQENALLNESAAMESSLTLQILELESESKQVNN